MRTHAQKIEHYVLRAKVKNLDAGTK